MALEVVTCVGPACREAAERNVDGVGPLCPGHRKQHQRGQLLAPLRGPHGELRPKTARQLLAATRDRLEDALQQLEDAKAEMLGEIERRGSRYANVDSDNDAAFKRAQRAFYEAVDEYARALARTRKRT